MKIRKNGCALKQLKEKKDKYIVQKKTRKIKMNFILSGAISNCPSANLLVGATNFDLFFFSVTIITKKYGLRKPTHEKI